MFIPGLRRNDQWLFTKAVEGLDSNRKDLDIGSKADVVQNARFDIESGSITKRAALAYYNAGPTAEGAAITSLYRYYNQANATDYTIILVADSLKSATSGTFATIGTLSNSSGKRFSAVTYKDLALISTGYDNIIQTDGLAAWELGSCKAGTATVGGSLDASKYYCYQIVFNTDVDGTSGTNTVCGAISNAGVTTGANKTIPLTNIPIGPTGTASRAIYRTEGQATAADAKTANAYLIHVIADNSTTTLNDDHADTTATGRPAVNHDMPKGKYLYVEQERLFVAGDTATGRQSYAYYSDQYLPHSIRTATADLSTTLPAGYYEIFSPDDGDVITGIAGQLGQTYIFKQNSIRPWYIKGVPETWEVGNVLSTVGLAAPYSLARTPWGIIYLSWDHFYIFNGQESQPIIDDIDIEETMLDARRFETFGYYWNNKYVAAYTDATEGLGYHDRVLWYDILRKQTSIDKGGDQSTGTGRVNIACFSAFAGGAEWGQLYGGDGVLGWVYQYDREIQQSILSTKSGIDAGTHSNTMVTGEENNPTLSKIVIEEPDYSTDALAQAAWVTSQTTALYKVPPDLGTGTDGALTLTENTSISGTKNYTSVTTGAYTLTCASGTVIKCLGTITVAGTLTGTSTDIYCHTYTNSGTTTGSVYIRCNTLNNSGTLTTTPTTYTDITHTDATLSDSPTDDNAHDGDFGTYYGISCSGDGASASGNSRRVYSATKFIYRIKYRWIINASTSAGASSNTAHAYAYIKTSTNSGSTYPTTLASESVSASGNQTSTTDSGTVTLDGNWTANAIKLQLECDSDKECNPACGGSQSAYAYGYELQVFSGTVADYLNSSGTVPSSGSTTDFVNALEVYSEDTIVNRGTYSLKTVCVPGATTLNSYVEKTLPASLDLSAAAHNNILIDVYALRSGAQFQIGLYDSGAAAYTYKDVTVTASNVWETVVVDYSATAGSSRDQITKVALKFTNTDSGNVVYVDNIRTGLYATCSYLSPRIEVNAGSLNKIYWNENLASGYGEVLVYTRTSNSTTDFTSWTDDTGWSASLTNPSGSTIASTAYRYIQYKIVFSSTDTTGKQFPYLYKADGFVVKLDYYKVASTAETGVEFRYRTGWRNFDLPMDDKIFKKLCSIHDATAGTMDIIVETDKVDTQTYTFSGIPLATYKKRYITNLPDTMYGKDLRVEWYNNDTNTLTLQQYGVQVEDMPLI